MPNLTRIFRVGSGMLLAAAMFSVAWLIAGDVGRHFQPGARHQEPAALALMFIGASFIFMQPGRSRPAGAVLKGVLLGSAFVLWGAEQFLPPGPWVSAMDTLVIVIFVTDLGLIVAGSRTGSRLDH